MQITFYQMTREVQKVPYRQKDSQNTLKKIMDILKYLQRHQFQMNMSHVTISNLHTLTDGMINAVLLISVPIMKSLWLLYMNMTLMKPMKLEENMQFTTIKQFHMTKE